MPPDVVMRSPEPVRRVGTTARTPGALGVARHDASVRIEQLDEAVLGITVLNQRRAGRVGLEPGRLVVGSLSEREVDALDQRMLLTRQSASDRADEDECDDRRREQCDAEPDGAQNATAPHCIVGASLRSPMIVAIR